MRLIDADALREKLNGQIRFIDPQSNTTDAAHYFSMGKQGGFGLFRMDDKLLTASAEIVSEAVTKGKKR